MKPTIEIIIDETGDVKIEVKNVKGKSCLDISKPIEDVLGDVEKRNKTSEFFQTERNAHRRTLTR